MIAPPMNEPTPVVSFDGLGLSDAVLEAVRAVGYETPSPIQQAAIPPLLAGRDLLGQAQTGTGKTAAFALPLLCRIDLKRAEPQLLVLTPTRELAIQVAEAMQKYARHLKGFHVLPIYGGSRDGLSVEAVAPRRARRGRNAGPDPGSPAPQDAEARQAPSRRHRRGRRDAADGLHRGRREHLGRDAQAEAGGALLRDVAGSHSQGRRAPPQRPRRGEDQERRRPRSRPSTSGSSRCAASTSSRR